MPPKRPSAKSIVDSTWNAISSHNFNLHKPFDKAKLDSLSWVASGTGHVCIFFPPATKAPTRATFTVIGRIENNDLSFKLTKDGNWSGKFENKFDSLRLVCNLGKAFPSDSTDAIDLVESWIIVKRNLNLIAQRQAKIPGILAFVDMISINHRLLQVKPAEVTEEDEVEDDDDDDAVPPAPTADDILYKPVDVSQDKTLTSEDWPWTPGSAAAIEFAKIASSHLVVPLPAYDAETGAVLLPADYVKLKGCLVCVHFNLRWNYIGGAKSKDVFGADIKRIEFLKSPTNLDSPSKRLRTTFTPPSNPTTPPRVIASTSGPSGPNAPAAPLAPSTST